MASMMGSMSRTEYGYNGEKFSAQTAAPFGKVLVDGYRKDLCSGGQDRSRTTPTNLNRERELDPPDLKDPIQVHLLTETALSDSKDYEILTQEEVDNIKRQIQSLTVRIEQTKSNLAIQSKYRDAAVSMARLYSPTKAEGRRRSLLGNNRSGSGDSAREAELERQASEARCEELASELFTLEKRLMDLQTRLLQHTAGILQMTHRASSRKGNQLALGQPLVPNNGIPGSPESLYAHSNGRNSLEPPGGDEFFDDRSLYASLEDQIDRQTGRPRKNTIEIPVKSPVRERNNQLREEADRLKEQKIRLEEAEEKLRADSDVLERQNIEQLRAIEDMERRLEGFNDTLKQMVAAIDPAKASMLNAPSPSNGDPMDSVQGQLARMGQGLSVVADQQNASRGMASTLDQVEARVDILNRQLWTALQSVVPNQPAPEGPQVGLDGQLNYLQDSLQIVDSELRRALELSSSVSASKQNNDQVEAVLMGLWDIIQSGYAGIQQQKAERRRTRIEKGLVDDDDDMSGDEAMNTNEPYSIQAFSTKVQWLYAQATTLKEQKGVLKRQIKQQRELSNKSGSEKDDELKQKQDELDQTRGQLSQTEQDVRDIQDKLSRALQDLELRDTSMKNESAAAQTVQRQLKERDATIASLENRSKETETKLLAADANIATIQAQLNQASEAKVAAEAAATKLEKDLRAKDEELENLNVMVIELKTEATIAKAELDGAYGSRRERAAEAAALSKSSETQGLATQVEKLKAELASTLKEFEEITKETIAAEKEKLDLEGKLDDALSAKASLESELNAARERLDRDVGMLKEQLDAEKLRAPASPNAAGNQRAGASMLSEQFRATMKAERKKFQEELREEQAKRRKLEDELRTLKRAQGAGRSPLGPLSPR